VTVNNEGARRLELLAPLVYSPAPDLHPFPPEGGGEESGASRPAPGQGERIFCFALDETQGRRIDPDPAGLLGPLLAAGIMAETAAGETAGRAAPVAQLAIDPAGRAAATADQGPVPAAVTADQAAAGPAVPNVPDAGRAPERMVHRPARVPVVELPRGSYLFAQERGTLNREEMLALVIDMQKDGLWERLRLGGHLYLRHVYGDHGIVTQIFRPYRKDGIEDPTA
jgi:hypothetical protein